jgi:3-deoxy-manno-octulosonate cytidylyltransferase (CMP-KDO synthetase)
VTQVARGRDAAAGTVVLIPARLKATRLPDKPLLPIAGLPMIVHVWRRAVEAGLGPVVVACAEASIAEAVTAAGGEAVLTDPDLPSGTDRIFQAWAGSTRGGGTRGS